MQEGSAPCWRAQACSELGQAEAELRRLQERHLAEARAVKLGVERALLGARREERRLLERVEQDHRDAQQRLEQVQKENMAATRVCQALLDQRLAKLAQLQRKVQEEARPGPGSEAGLLDQVRELTQPWEISLSLKRVSFRPSAQANAVSFGEIRVQEQNLCLRPGPACPYHAQQDGPCPPAGADQAGPEGAWPSAVTRVVQKISLCEQSGWEAGEETGQGDASRDGTGDGAGGEDVFLAVPSAIHAWERGTEALLASEQVPAASQRRGEDQTGYTPSRGLPRCSHSLGDLTCRGRPSSCLSTSSLGTPCDSGRALSPTDSLDSSYTFVVSSSSDGGLRRTPLGASSHLSRSAVDLSRGTRPLIGTAGTGQSPEPGWAGAGQCRAAQLVGRSLSMSTIDGSARSGRDMRDGGTFVFGAVTDQLIGRFGKQGCGRADFTLPSGLHATPQGLLYVVDCGNTRVQVTDRRGNVVQQVASPPSSSSSSRRCRNYFDVAVNSKSLIALSCAAERALLVFSRHGRLLQRFGGARGGATDELEAPRGVTVTRADDFLVADVRKGSLVALRLDPRTGARLERTVVPGFHRPYLVAACPGTGVVAVCERGGEAGRPPCVKVLDPSWTTVRVLGACSAAGPVLACPWGVCVDPDGGVLVADWAEPHRVLLFPPRGPGRPVVTRDLSSPRGLALLPGGLLALADSMNHCIKIYRYRDTPPSEGHAPF